MSLGHHRAGIEKLLARETELVHLASLERDETLQRREPIARSPTAEGLLRQSGSEGAARRGVVQKKAALPQT